MSRTPTAIAPPPSEGGEEKAIPILTRWFGSWRVSLHRRALNSVELKAAYDCEAPGWSRTLEFLRMQCAYKSALRKVLYRERVVFGAHCCRVLDCGVGDGAFSAAFAEVNSLPINVDAVDLSPQMLALAGQRLRDLDVKVELHLTDSQCLPFDDNAFDIILTAHMLEHLADPQAALREMTRVLKPGGLLIACVTRQSLLGRYIQAKWRTHAVTRQQAEEWFRSQELQGVFSLSNAGHEIFDRMSIVCVGRKPFRARI